MVQIPSISVPKDYRPIVTEDALLVGVEVCDLKTRLPEAMLAEAMVYAMNPESIGNVVFVAPT